MKEPIISVGSFFVLIVKRGWAQSCDERLLFLSLQSFYKKSGCKAGKEQNITARCLELLVKK